MSGILYTAADAAKQGADTTKLALNGAQGIASAGSSIAGGIGKLAQPGPQIPNSGAGGNVGISSHIPGLGMPQMGNQSLNALPGAYNQVQGPNAGTLQLLSQFANRK